MQVSEVLSCCQDLLINRNVKYNVLMSLQVELLKFIVGASLCNKECILFPLLALHAWMHCCSVISLNKIHIYNYYNYKFV